MQKFVNVSLIAFLGIFISNFVFSQGSTKTIDKIVAQVGDNVVLYSEIQAQKQMVIDNGGTVDASTECQLLEQMMYQFLLVNQAELDSIVISDEQVDAEMENRIRSIEAQMAKQKDENGNPFTFESFYGKSKAAVKEEFRETIKKRMQGQEVERGITGNIAVSPREVDAFFHRIPKDSLPLINSQLAFQQIAIFPVVTNADKEATKARLNDIRKMVVTGKMSMERAAREYSLDPGSAKDGGFLEATVGMMVKPFEQTALRMKIGEISEVFETEYGYHFLQLVDRKGDDYSVRHVLLIPEPSLDSLDAAGRRIEECYNLLRENKITWEMAVKKYSNDPNTKENNGYISNPFTGEQKWSIEDINQVDPQMFLLTDALGVNQVSSPSLYQDFMERKQGLRIVRLNERTQPHVANLKDDYNLFRMMAEEEKKNNAILAWTKSRISTAYVRIDDDFKNCVFQSNWTPTAP